MKHYKVWLKTWGATEFFIIAADCIDDAIEDAKSQLPKGTRIYSATAQRV